MRGRDRTEIALIGLAIALTVAQAALLAYGIWTAVRG